MILTVQLAEGMEYLNNSSLFDDFEAIYPNLELNVIYKPFRIEDYILPPVYGLTEHLDAVDKFTQEADVLMMSVGEGFNQLSIEATRAGYILDLVPLFNASRNADPLVYYPTVWQAAQWDGGLWILPTSTTIHAIVYDAMAFDEAGVAYPTGDWTISNFTNAAESLVVRDATGKSLAPGFTSNQGEGALVYSLLGQSFYDISQIPFQPRLLTANSLAFTNIWMPSIESGAIFNPHYDYGSDFRIEQSPLTIGRLSLAYLNGLEFAPLPGNQALVNINGFVVSSRTEYPELAYELASYLAANRLIADAMSLSWGGMSLARPEYPDVVAVRNAPYSLDASTEEARLLINEALQNGIPASELLYYPYFQDALYHAATGEVDVETALRDAETLAMNNLTIAEARRSQIAGTIPTPVPEVVLADGEIELRFYYQEGDTNLWQAFADEFTANDPEVGRVVMQSPDSGFDYREEGTDCFYANAIISQIASDYLLDIAPLIAVDATLNPDDWLTGVFNSVQQDNSIYALPIDIRPLALWYDPNIIEATGLQVPQNSSELLDALNTLGSEGNPALASYQLGTSLLMLMAAEGAVPINYQSQPIQIDFTSSENLAAMQRILNLARAGIIKYGSIVNFASDSFPESEPLLLDYVADSMFRNAAYSPVTFPVGNQYTAVSYQTIAGFISRFSQYPEACYRLLRSLSQRPDLINGVPVQRSQALRSDYASFYDSFNQQLNSSNVLRIPTLDTEFDYFSSYWLFRAFDRYVLENADLLTEMSAAEQFTNDYLLCVEAGTSPGDCARAIDPIFSTLGS